MLVSSRRATDGQDVASEGWDGQRNPKSTVDRKMKEYALPRSLARALVAVALLSIVGAAIAKTTITFWTHTHPPMLELNKQLIEEYEAENPDIEIEYQIIPNNQFFEKMIVSLSTGVGPDVINMGNTQLVSDYIPRGLVAPLDFEAMGYDSLAQLQAKYVPAGLQGAEVDGTYYGRPSEFNTNMLIINVSDLVAAGYDADWAPKTWEELGKVAGDLSKFDANGNQTHRGFDLLYLHASWYQQQFEVFTTQTGCAFFNADNTESTVSSPECIQAAKIWQDMIYKYKAANPKLASGASTVPVEDYISGGVSMTFIQPWGMELVRGANEELWNNSNLVPLPQVDPQNPKSSASAYYWAVNNASQVQDEAWKFVDFLASHPGRWLKDVNFLQATANLSELPEAGAFPYADQWLTALQAGNFPRAYPHANEVNEALKSTLESVLLNDNDVQKAFDGLKNDLNRIIQ